MMAHRNKGAETSGACRIVRELMTQFAGIDVLARSYCVEGRLRYGRLRVDQAHCGVRTGYGRR